MNAKHTILVVDDTPENIDVVVGLLSNNYKLIAVTSGEEALEIAFNKAPDLILLDIVMPAMDGYEVCQKLKTNPTTRDVPIIFLTAKTDVEDIVKGFDCGAADYVVKPFNPPELMARVRTHLNLKQSKEALAKKNIEQKELIHVLCHDLTNPIGAVKSFLTMADMNSKLLEDNKAIMLMAVDNALKIIDLIREIKAMDEGKSKIKLESINLKEAVNESVTILQRKFSQKKIELISNVDEDLNIQAERVSLINSVLNNIFTNAIKFSFPDSKITVETKKEEDIILTVRDFGIGMSKTLLNDLFLVNKATQRTGTSGERGTGFGMSLMKKFILAYDGSIEISAKEYNETSTDHGTHVKLKFKATH